MIFPRFFQCRFFLACALGVVVLSFAPLKVDAASLVSHRAIYSLKMGEVRTGSSFVDAEGAMSLVMERTCDGWILTQNLTMNLSTPEGRTLRQSSRYTGLESFDGKSYRFLSDNKTPGDDKRIKGRASSGGFGVPGQAIFKLPEEKTLELPERTLFPMAQTAWVIDQAIAGVRHAPHYVFDGSDGTGPRKAAAFIGPLFYPAKDKAKKDSKTALGALAQRPGWNVRIAFFPLDSKKSTPEYEMEVLQLDNGVASRLLLDYGTMTVVLELEKIEAIKPPVC